MFDSDFEIGETLEQAFNRAILAAEYARLRDEPDDDEPILSDVPEYATA